MDKYDFMQVSKAPEKKIYIYDGIFDISMFIPLVSLTLINILAGFFQNTENRTVTVKFNFFQILKDFYRVDLVYDISTFLGYSLPKSSF